MSVRGVVLSSTASISSTQFSLSGGIDPVELKRLLLYWERMSYAAIHGMGPNLAIFPDLEFLHREGILSIEAVHLPVETLLPANAFCGPMILGIPLAHYRDIQLEGQMALAKAKALEGSIWAVAQFGEDLELSQISAQDGNLWEFKLYGCLPVPGPTAAIQDVLEFREKHSHELMQLRFVLEEMRSSIVNADDAQRAFILCSEKLSFSIAEIVLALEKARLPFRLETLKAFLEAKESYVLSAALSALGAGGLSAPLSLGAAGVAATATLSLVLRVLSGVNKIPENLRDFAYVYRAQKEFGVGSRDEL